MANMGYDENLPTQTPAAMSERAASPWQGDYDFPPSVDVVVSVLNFKSTKYKKFYIRNVNRTLITYFYILKLERGATSGRIGRTIRGTCSK